MAARHRIVHRIVLVTIAQDGEGVVVGKLRPRHHAASKQVRQDSSKLHPKLHC